MEENELAGVEVAPEVEDEADAVIEGEDEGDLVVEAGSGGIQLSKNDRSLSELHRWYTRGRLIVDPAWQRQYVWDNKRASRLIESFMIGLPVPVIYLALNDENKYEVIDGLQRLTSVFNYFENKYALAGLEIRDIFNGRKFSALSQAEQGQIEDATIRTFELANTTDKDLMFIIFERLNTGGVSLNDMEIRNCLFRGKLNDLIKELAEDESFLKCVNQKGLKKRMKDRMLVLRFLAFYQLHYSKARQGLKAFFNEFFTTYRNPQPKKIEEFRDHFKKAARAAYSVFGDRGFRLRRNTSKGKKGGEWSSSINASIFQILMVSFTRYDVGSLTRSADNILEAYLDLVASDETWVDYVTRGTGAASRLEYTFSVWEQRLKTIMAASVPNDSKRLFSRALKDEMFAQNATCELCQQRISAIDDAALDHHKEYYLGGQTVPENARLVHRQCNLERPRKGG